MKKNFIIELLEKLNSADEETKKKLIALDKSLTYLCILGVSAIELATYIAKKQFNYSDILKMFKEDKIAYYHLDMSSRELTFRRKDNGALGIANIPDTKLFLDDIHEFVKSHNERHPESQITMNYTHGISSGTFIGIGVAALAAITLLNTLQSASRGPQQIRIINGEDFGKGGGGGPHNVIKSTYTLNEGRTAKFEDVAGAEEEKEELAEIVQFLKEPDKFRRLGARVPKGVLLEGPPGTGKTLLARAVAGEAGVPFFSISGSEFVEMYVGVGAARVRDLFNQARDKAPCIIFIDEIDAIARSRAADLFSGNEERESTLNQILVEMDGFSSESGIILIGATNRADILDKALLRPGRFDRRVRVGYPDINGRKAIMDVHSKNKPLSEDVDLYETAKATSGFTGADLENLLNEAALLAAKRDKASIGTEELKEAAVKVMMGAEKKSRKVIDKERKLTAYHEAGHAIATYNLETLDPVEEVSIIPRGSAGGYTMSLPQEDKIYMSRNEMLDELVSLLGGRVAEAITLGDVSTGASNDIERATALARAMITRYGMSDELGPISLENGQQSYYSQKNYSEKTASRIDEEIESLLKLAYKRTEDILNEHRAQLNALAEYLLENEKIDGENFKELMEKTA